MLTIATCRALCDHTEFTGMEAWGKLNEAWLRRFLELPNGNSSHDTFPPEPVTLKRSQRRSLVQRALEITEEELPGLAIESICVRLHCSRRTLEYAFHEGLGMAPGAYLKLRRLNRGRELLILADPQQSTVGQIASTLGFDQSGRFAADYHRLFGEHPSQTLTRPASRRVAAFGIARFRALEAV